MANDEHFFARQGKFPQEYQGNLRSMAEKGMPVGMLPFFKHGIKAHGKRSLP
jgi:hypothetical protein